MQERKSRDLSRVNKEKEWESLGTYELPWPWTFDGHDEWMRVNNCKMEFIVRELPAGQPPTTGDPPPSSG